MKNSMKKMIGILLAAVMIASIFSVLPISASAAGENELPASFDLRDRGVVTPIRIQDPWGSCWAFDSNADEIITDNVFGAKETKAILESRSLFDRMVDNVSDMFFG